MSAEAPSLIRTFKVGRYDCTLTVPAIRPGAACMAVVEWSPCVPERLTSEEAAEYRREMAAAVAALVEGGGDVR